LEVHRILIGAILIPQAERKIHSKARKLDKLVAFVQHQQLMLDEHGTERAVLKGELEAARRDSRWQASERDALRERLEGVGAIVEEWKRKCIDLKDHAMHAKATANAERNSIAYECELWKKKTSQGKSAPRVLSITTLKWADVSPSPSLL
jgi:DNA repair exonuclease SbcCD ATPase subunit